MIKLIPLVTLLATLVALPAITAGQSVGAGATGQGVINSVDAEKGLVNITHGPIPALSWPEMTMDLPVVEGIDLSDVQPDDEVRFRVGLGPDQVYRITEIDAAP